MGNIGLGNDVLAPLDARAKNVNTCVDNRLCQYRDSCTVQACDIHTAVANHINRMIPRSFSTCSADAPRRENMPRCSARNPKRSDLTAAVVQGQLRAQIQHA